MIIVDTSVWIEFLKGNDPYLALLSKRLEESQILAMECIFGELLQGAKSKREREIILAYWENLPKFPEENIYIKAGLEAGKHQWHSKGIGLIDGAIIILLRTTGSSLWTLDKKLKNILLPHEIFEI
jgi:predicted nucleic acid-binding protein